MTDSEHFERVFGHVWVFTGVRSKRLGTFSRIPRLTFEQAPTPEGTWICPTNLTLEKRGGDTPSNFIDHAGRDWAHEFIYV